jgi:peptidylprolyl isomerase
MKGRSFIVAFVACVLAFGCSNKGADPSTPSNPKQDPVTHKDPGKPTPPVGKVKIEDLTVGKGEGAKTGDMVTVLYRGKLANGKVFDGNMDDKQVPTPEKSPYGVLIGSSPVIMGWHEGLVGIKVGGVRKLSIPPSLGYGDQPHGNDIPANSDLYFTVKCLDIVKEGEEKIIDIQDIKQGTGTAVKDGDTVTVNFVGTLLNGKQFDSTKEEGKVPFTFTVGEAQVVAGFDRGMIGMKKGGVRKVRVPPGAAFSAGLANGIPENAVLMFEIELLNVKPK